MQQQNIMMQQQQSHDDLWTCCMERNAEAIAAMHRGEHLLAASILSGSLHALAANAETTVTAMEKKTALHPPVATSTISRPLMILAAIPLDPLTRTEETLSIVPYNSVFLLPSLSSSSCLQIDAPPPSMACIACILTFNMAVALHRQGTLTGCSEITGQALHVYHRAHAIATKLSNDEFLALIRLIAAVYHNMCQIHAECFCALPEAKYLRARLLEIFASFAMKLGWQDYSFFHVQLFLSLSADFRLAPAA